jgi:hypothetical protein
MSKICRNKSVIMMMHFFLNYILSIFVCFHSEKFSIKIYLDYGFAEAEA